jgi:hypothetical protein
MRRLLFGLVLLLAACSSPGPAPPPPGTASAAFAGPDLIKVVVSDYVPARQVELIGPLGVLPAQAIDTTRDPYYGSSGYGSSVGIGLGAGGGGRGGFGFGGIGLGLPLSAPSAPAYGLVVSTAQLRLPDPQSYAANWQSSQLRIVLGDPPNQRILTIPAPAPPPPG